MNTIYFVIIMIWLCAIWIKVNNVQSDIEEIKIRCKYLFKMQELLCNHLIDNIMEVERNNEHNNQI